MAKPFNIDLKQKGRSAAATKSNISFGHFHRRQPFRKPIDFSSQKLKNNF